MSNLISYSAYKALDAPKKALDKLSIVIKCIYNAPNVNRDEKRQIIDNCVLQSISVGKEGNRAFEMLKVDIEKLKKRAEGKKSER